MYLQKSTFSGVPLLLPDEERQAVFVYVCAKGCFVVCVYVCVSMYVVVCDYLCMCLSFCSMFACMFLLYMCEC